MRTIAVTGVSGYLGTRLLQRLEEHADVENIIGISRKPPPLPTPKLKFFSRDVSKDFSDVFRQNRVDAAIHLAFAVKPTQNEAGARRVNVDGARNFIEACKAGSVEHMLYVSSHTVYGPHPDNPIPLTEDSPLRPIRSFQYSWDKGLADRIFQDYMKANSTALVTVVRACSILGPQAAGSVSTGIFQPVMIRLNGYDPYIQYIHDEDLAEIILTLLGQKQRGVFNAGGADPLRYREIIAATGKPCIPLPAGPLSFLLGITWRLRLQSQSPAGGLGFIKYPIVLDTTKLERTTGYRFRYNTREPLLSYLNAGKRPSSLSNSGVER